MNGRAEIPPPPGFAERVCKRLKETMGMQKRGAREKKSAQALERTGITESDALRARVLEKIAGTDVGLVTITANDTSGFAEHN